MAYWISVERVALKPPLHVYAYGREGEPEGCFTYDGDTGTLYPSDGDGSPTSEARVTVDGEVEEQADLARETWLRFIEATVGVASAVRRGEPAPAQADRVFG